MNLKISHWRDPSVFKPVSATSDLSRFTKIVLFLFLGVGVGVGVGHIYDKF